MGKTSSTAMADVSTVKNESIIVESREIKQADWSDHTFLPPHEDKERQQARINSHRESFPTLGIGALAGALALILLSAIILLVIQGPGKVVSDWTVQVPKTNRHVTIPKPAAWLSAVLSGISVCFHIALSEGLNVAWWHTVRQQNATVRDLHTIWGHGTSTWTVIKTGAADVKDGIVGLNRNFTNRNTETKSEGPAKRFSFVALATLFVATIPLNGFLLQNAVIVQLEPTSKNDTVNVPMLNGSNFNDVFQVYATGDLSGGGVRAWSTPLGLLSQLITPKIAAAADLGSFNTTCLGSCKTTVRGMGFNIQCEDSVQAYDIPINSANPQDPTLTGMVVNGTDVVTVGVTYNYNITNRVTIRSMWKNRPTCKGNYSIQTCHLDLATVEYPIVINSGVKEATQNGLRNTTIMTLGLNLLKESPKVVNITPSAFTGLTATSTYAAAGLAGLFAQTLNSTINLSYNFLESDYGTSVAAQGLFAQQQLATTATFNTAYPSCQGTVGNITQQALAVVQSMMFQMGAYNWLSSYGASDPSSISIPNGETIADVISQNTPRPMALQSYERNEYQVVWAWYFGAMALTTIVSFAILPIFRGYDRLERKTTMSPFETARAFHAPILYQNDSTIKSDDLIKRVGNVQINRDLPVVPVTPPELPRRPGVTW